MYGDEFDKRERRTENFENDAPQWQPDPVRYNTEHRPVKRKSAKRWVVPLVIIIAVLVAVVITGFTVGSKYLNNLVQARTAAPSSEAVEEPAAEEVAETVPAGSNNVVWTDVVQEESSSGGVVLTDVTDIVDDVFPAVVSITSRTIINNSDYFNFFFGYDSSPYDEGSNQREVDSGIGSGTIIGQEDDSLLILTSYHVVEGSSSLAVTFVNGTSVDGVIKSANSDTDIAIVSVPLSEIDEETMSSIKTAKLSSTPARMGEGVVVIGNAMGYGMSVTTGIVSAVDRQLTVEGKVISVIQTDAAINSGNSGGCMLNSKGEVIGISEAKIIVTGVEGMCYAIPISSNTDLIKELLEEETPVAGEDETTAQGAYLGIRGRDITTDLANTYGMPQGVYVSSVVKGGGAEAAGITNGDIITALDGVEATTMAKLQFELAKHNPGDAVKVTVMREGNNGYAKADIEVTLTDAVS